MSLLIKGVKLTDCWNCPCVDGEYGECNVLGKAIKSVRGRLDDCPLIELPDHGDLIDKNRMIDVLHHGNKCVSEIQKDAKDEASISYCQGVMIGYTNSIVALDGAPVVIPAERS